MEVRGVEPRSAEFSVSNSPSAAAGCCRLERSRQPFLLEPIRDLAWPDGPRYPPGASCQSDALFRRGRHHRRGRATYRSGGQRHLWFGTYCCLPSGFARDRAPRLASDTVITSTSNPSHPHALSVQPTIQTPCDIHHGVFGPHKSQRRRPTRRMPRSISRRCSRSLMTCRLSTLVRPLAKASSILALPFRK